MPSAFDRRELPLVEMNRDCGADMSVSSVRTSQASERMRERYSSVDTDEQREAVAAALEKLPRGFGPGSRPEGRPGDSENQYAPHGVIRNGALSQAFLGAGEGIRTPDVNLGKVALYH